MSANGCESGWASASWREPACTRGPRPFRLSERIFALPIATLWG